MSKWLIKIIIERLTHDSFLFGIYYKELTFTKLEKDKLNNNVFLFIINLLLVLIEYYFIPVYYIWSKPYNLVKMVFQTIIFRPLSREPTHAHHKQRVNKIFRNYVCPSGNLQSTTGRLLHENILLALSREFHMSSSNRDGCNII